MKQYKVAVVGATGLVGGKMLEVLAERNFPFSEIIPAASEKSVGKKVTCRGEWTVVSLQEAVDRRPDIALFSAGASVSKQWAPIFAAAGIYVIDNSSCWRMDPTKKLVVPEINAGVLTPEDHIIANPNCSTIQMLVALWPLHQKYGIKRIVVSTYQSVTGSGMKGIAQLERERALDFSRCAETAGASDAGGDCGDACAEPLEKTGLPQAYPHPIDLNVLPHIDSFLEDGYTKEEMKMVNETHKIFDDYSIGVSATCVRVPVRGGHSESVNVEFIRPFEMKDIRTALENAPGIVLQDDPASNLYPLPLYAAGKDETFVGRLRRDTSVPNGLNLWVVSDNLRKGAATNAVQIAECLVGIL